MRAAKGGAHERGGHHLSGSERLVHEEEMHRVTCEMLERARQSHIHPDFIRMTFERVALADVTRIPCLPVTPIVTSDSDAAIKFASQILVNAGIQKSSITAAFEALTSGLTSNPGGVLRGASLWDKETAERLEPDLARGIRATHLDYSPEGDQAARDALFEHGLLHFRTREALAIATKVLWSGVIAEICWSDDPNYTTGYITTPQTGYLRIPNFKSKDAYGGRIFFVDAINTNLSQCIDRLERQCVWLDPPLTIHPAIAAEGYSKKT